MPTKPGQMLSHYRLVEKLGEGGMGEVWRAVDTTLDRDVAIKILPEHFSRDPERLGRFEREAKLLAALNHRNIATIYGLDEADGIRFLVMELVEGEDLARRLVRGPLRVDEAIDVCHQLARALEAAHEKGVLHRDLKPANIQVTHEGRVKVLDFGLAKAFEVESSDTDPTMSPTLTSVGTRAGVILGTAAYMSPEQARGKAMDKRTDIWSFGCVLYECLVGRSAFHGETVSDTLASILKTEPNWAALPEQTPPRVCELLQRCLEKDVRNRLRDVGDARLELQRSIAGHESLADTSGVGLAGVREERRPRLSSMLVLAAAVVIGAVAGAGLWSWLSGAGWLGLSGPAEVARFSVNFPPSLIVEASLLSPDGNAVAFAGRPRRSPHPEQDLFKLYLRQFHSFAVEPIEGSEGVATFCFSPDGRWLAMLTPVAPKSTSYRLSKVPVDGSAPPQLLAAWSDDWEGPLLWLSDGDLLARLQDPPSLVRIPVDGSPPRNSVEIRPQGFEGKFMFFSPPRSALPDGVHVLGRVWTYTQGYEQDVAVLNLETGEARILIENGSFAQWSPTGHLLFTRGETLMAAPFDLDRVTTSGGQVAITDGLRAFGTVSDAWFEISADGTLAYFPGGLVGVNRRLALVDGEANIEGFWSEDRRPFASNLVVSGDGRRLAVVVVNAEGLYDIWASDMDRPRLTQLVHDPAKDCIPHLWSPDGESLVYECWTATSRDLYIRSGDGAGQPELLIETETVAERYIANAFLRDGSKLVVTHQREGKAELMLMPLRPGEDGTRAPYLLIADANSASVSPDGRWITYQSDTSGRVEVYLRRIFGDGSLGSEIPVSTSGGGGAIWYRGYDTSPLVIRYVNQLNIFDVFVTAEPEVGISEPKFIVDISEMYSKFIAGHPMPDGRYIGIVQGEGEEEVTEVNVVLNWYSELEARLRSAR
jgi:serine/threonine-protein kinase